MLGRPVYGAFARDLAVEAKINLEYVSVGDMDQCCPSSVARLDDGFENAKARGIESARVIDNTTKKTVQHRLSVIAHEYSSLFDSGDTV
ncbi:hypothetical protein AFLA_001772 [Aspergillus flavus NRRL3357]|nr:hypothetical protein AFLA_001772 [Aspergillus flavus NRRL3357]